MEILSLPAHTLFHIGPMPVTDGHLALMLVIVMVAIFGLYVAGTAKLVPTRAQMAFEMAVFWLYDRITPMVPQKKYANFVFALVASLFLMIIVSNLFFAFPFTTMIFEAGHEHSHLFRVPTSHFSMTLAMGLMVVLLSHILALTISPWKQIGHFIKLQELFKARSIGGVLNGFLEIFLGLLEIIGQVSRTISISARLFGNIFAGEVMVEVIMKLSAGTQFIVPLPFYALNLFVGIIQALVFTLLTIQYIGGMIEGVSGEHAH
jgi:F-type H+-transporting ATPase subunit a